MGKQRFQLRADETATQNLWRAVRMATYYMLGRKHFFGLKDDFKAELVDNLMLDTYEHFVEYKVKKHKYDRTWPFFSNVLSSCWTVMYHSAGKVIRQMDAVLKAEDIHHPYYGDTVATEAGFPLYLADRECYSYRHRPLSQVRMDFYVQTIKEEYETQKEEAIELGFTPPTWEAWLASTGYSKDNDLMVWLEPDRKVRKKLINKIRRSPELAEKFPRTYEVNHKLGRKRKKKDESGI